MPIFLESNDLPISAHDINRLWQAVCGACAYADKNVTVVSLSEETVRRLNRDYRHHDTSTNVLTFSYGEMPLAGTLTSLAKDYPVADHDIIICLAVAKKEAKERQVSYRDYVALLLVHAFLHAAGMDHERTLAEAAAMQLMEKKIMVAVGFSALTLSA